MIKLKFSRLKVENVLNPPQKPIITKYFNESCFARSDCTKAKPKIKLASKLAKIVAIGRPLIGPKYIDRKYLNNDPKPPPINIIKLFTLVCFLIFAPLLWV